MEYFFKLSPSKGKLRAAGFELRALVHGTGKARHKNEKGQEKALEVKIFQSYSSQLETRG